MTQEPYRDNTSPPQEAKCQFCGAEPLSGWCHQCGAEPKTAEAVPRSEAEALADLTRERDAARSEVERLRQGLWDCGMLAGMDCDGDLTPKHLVSDIVELIKGEVAELRNSYDEALEEMP